MTGGLWSLIVDGVCRFVSLVLVAAVLCCPANADIKAYNEAALRGDFAAAAVEAEAIWPDFDKTRPETAIVAREFAWSAMMAGKSEQANRYATWLIEEGPSLETPDQDPLLSKVLLYWSVLGEKPAPQAAADLSIALQAWAAQESNGSRIAVIAAAQLYAREWNLGRWNEAGRDAKLTVDLAARLGGEGMTIEERARVDAAAAQFLGARKIDAWLAMADAHDALVERMGPPIPGEDIEDLVAIGLKADAWLDAMGAYLRSGPSRRDDKIMDERKLKTRCGDDPCPEPLAENGAIKCPATWDQSPKMKYPPNALYRGAVGATILELTTDETGEVADAKVLAAVPNETFPEATMKTVRRWTLRKDAGAPEGCTLAGTRNLHVVFQFP